MKKTIDAIVSQPEGEGEGYALDIVADGFYVDIFTLPRNRTRVVFFDLPLDELLQLGQSIMAEAGRLVVEQEEK